MKKKLGEVLLANSQDPPRGSFLIPQFTVKYSPLNQQDSIKDVSCSEEEIEENQK